MPRLSFTTFAQVCAAVLLSPAIFLGQTISIVSGNGQLICPACPGNTSGFSFAPAVVVVKDASGNPVSGATVTWTTTLHPINLPPQTVTTTSVTDANGLTSYTPQASAPLSTASYGQTTVTASISNSTVQFIETLAVPSAANNFSPVSVVQLSPQVGVALTGGVGQVGSTPIKILVNTGQGGIPNVSVSLGPYNSATWPGPSITCQTAPGQAPGTVLTDNTGTATCIPVFGTKIGTGQYQASVGGLFYQLTPETFTVTPGSAAIIKVISGTPQSANQGAIFPLPLVAQVTDLGGNPASGASVVWTVSPTGGATLSSTTTTTDSNGYISTRATAGTSGGQVQVTVSLPQTMAKGTFTLTVNVPVSGITVASGNNQQTAIGTAFPQPLIVTVNNGTQPVQNVAVNFAVTSGPATLSAASATTDSQGQAQVTATAGSTTGPIVITASVVTGSKTYTAVFNLTAVPSGPIITSVVNSAGFQSQFVSPCSLATIYGTNLATGLQGFVTSLVAPQMQMAGVSVQFGTASAPVLTVVNENGQESVTVQVPCETVPGTVPMTVTAGSGTSTPFNVTVLPLSPGLFETQMSDGKRRAVLVRPDGSYVSLENPARRGEIIRMYATGLGQTTPPMVTGQTVALVLDSLGNPTPEIMDVNAQVVVGVNNAGVRVVYARYAWNLVGVYEVAFEVPADTATGNNVPFAIALYQNTNPPSLLFGNGSAIPIQ